MPVSDTLSPWLLPAVSLWKREVVRFLRQRSRVIGALGTPLVFWVLVGSGLRNSVRVPGLPGASGDSNYLQYAFPGTIAMIVLFTAIFSMISVIEDRREGFLQAVIASPVRRSAVVFGKVLGSTTLAVGQSILFLLLAPLVGVPLSVASFVAVLGVLVVMSIGLSGLGLLIAWPMDSTQGFHAV
ncbi:MAG: ABC transporter permease, partial [Planctomycetota bacterium]